MATIPTKQPIYVWECLGEQGGFGLCTNPNYDGFGYPTWKFRGELASVPEIGGFLRHTIERGTARGWPMVVYCPGREAVARVALPDEQIPASGGAPGWDSPLGP